MIYLPLTPIIDCDRFNSTNRTIRICYIVMNAHIQSLAEKKQEKRGPAQRFPVGPPPIETL